MASMERTRSIWQLGSGQDRSYADVFLKYGVGLIGDGDAGQWTSERNDKEFKGGFVRRFASELNLGDIVLLRNGVSTICAVGIVVSGYKYLKQFDDVNGWDLQHARRIRWCRLPQDFDFGSPIFGSIPSRCSRTRNEEVISYAERFLQSPPMHWQSAPLPELPPEESALDEVPEVLRSVIALAQDLAPIYWDREGFGDLPTEHELVAHLVIPFLMALGWHQEQIAVEWRDIDVSVFSTLPRLPKNCAFIVEAKRLGDGIEYALDQAKGYVKKLKVPRDIVLTDGIRYQMYSCEDGFEPVAYANLTRLKQSASGLFTKMKRP